jgi:beta-carotene hydroxylase
MLRLLNPVIACALSTMLAAGGYLIAHEAIHGNLGRTGGRRFWLNDLVGWATLVPLVLPFSVGRLTHLSHHLHCNDPLLDPDYCDDAPGKRAALLTTFRNRQPAVQGINYLRTLERIGTPEAIAARRQSQIMQLAYLAILFTMAWSGHAIEAALIWWLPRQLALSYLRFTFSWAPHHPRGERRGRYRNTRVFRCWAGNLASMGMQYHIIHHLYPHILVHRHKPAFGAMRHVLEARGVDCSAFPLRPQPGRSAVLVA